MKTKRRLKKIGGSIALFIPPEMLEELRLGPDAEVGLLPRAVASTFDELWRVHRTT